MDIWDSERLHTIGSIMSRYSPHMRNGVRVRIGCEGDPCGTFRAADAPVGTVENVRRDGSKLHFDLHMPDGTVRKMNNISIDPGDCWEIDPDYVETFRGHVEEDLRGKENQQGGEDVCGGVEDSRRDWEGESELFRNLARRGETRKSQVESLGESVVREANDDLGTMRDQLEELEQRFRRAEKEHQEFRETMASTVRHIAGDVFRSSKGQEIEFSPTYIDRFDVTQGRRADGGSPQTEFRRGASSLDDDDRHDFQDDRRDRHDFYSRLDDYRSSSFTKKRKASHAGFREAHQSEKTDFPMRTVPYDDLAGDGTDVTS